MLPAVSPHLQALQSAHDGYILVSSVSLELLDVIYTELLIKGARGAFIPDHRVLHKTSRETVM